MFYKMVLCPRRTSVLYNPLQTTVIPRLYNATSKPLALQCTLHRLCYCSSRKHLMLQECNVFHARITTLVQMTTSAIACCFSIDRCIVFLIDHCQLCRQSVRFGHPWADFVQTERMRGNDSTSHVPCLKSKKAHTVAILGG